MKMKTLQVLTAASLLALLGGCATHPKDVAKLDAKINEVTAEDFGQFLYHSTLSEENLAETRKIRQWWKDDHYWNVDTEQQALEAAARALKHRQMAEKHLEGWHDRCVRHPDVCIKEELITVAHFDTGSAKPKSIEQGAIHHLTDLSRIHHPLTVEVIGYTDTVGSSSANKSLAARRANAIHALLKKHGIDSHTVVKEIGYGEAGGPDNTANAHNRRDDVKVHLYQPYPR